jgi:two-component system, OmpR family, sensor kinase
MRHFRRSGGSFAAEVEQTYCEAVSDCEGLWGRCGRSRRNGRWGRWPYSRLRHRIFGSILMSIIGTVAFVIFAAHVFEGEHPATPQLSQFVSEQFAYVWNEPNSRIRLAADIEKSFGVGLVLLDGDKRVLYGKSHCARPNWQTSISGPAGSLGTLNVCLHHPPSQAKSVAVGLLLGLFMLWGASGAITWRLVRPLDELQRVTREIGQGKLAARMRLHRHRRDELGEIAEAVNDMAVRIERQVSDQRELLAGVSHEIRTPLSRLRVLVELERSAHGDPKRLDAIEAELVEIDGLVGQLLAQSKLDFSALDKRRLSANELANAALERAALSSTLLNGFDGDDIVLADPSLIARALANIIGNAERHGAGLIELAVRQTGAFIEFVALDAGPGIESSVLSRMFAPFERGGDKAGLGLGLSLVERIARAHGGQAFGTPREGGGAAVGFRIPRLAGGSTQSSEKSP